MQRQVRFPGWFSCNLPFLLSFPHCLVIFKLSITPYAAKITYKTYTFTSFAIERLYSWVFLMRMFTLTTRSPSINIKSFASWHPPLPKFFWSSRYEFKCLTRTVLTIRLDFVFLDLLMMLFKKVTTKTSAFTSNPEALIFLWSLTHPCYIDTVHLAFLCVFKFPAKHLFSSRCCTNLLH